MIGKTRQQPATSIQQAQVEEVYDPEVGKARGVLRRPLPAGKMRHARKRPSPDLEYWVAHYWMIHWDLHGCESHIAESLPHPNVHLIFEPALTVICGVHTHKFSRVLEGESQVFGIKFKPGGFRAFLKSPVSRLANRMVPAQQIFGAGVDDIKIDEIKDVLLSAASEDEKVEAANAFLRARAPESDKTIELASQLVERILEERDIKTVDDVVSRTGIGKRSLQRIFNEYVGVSPKWVIRRYRLHEVIERSHSGDRPDWAQLALELGYFDQAHLINDFRALTGYSPTEYQGMIRKDL